MAFHYEVLHPLYSELKCIAIGVHEEGEISIGTYVYFLSFLALIFVNILSSGIIKSSNWKPPKSPSAKTGQILEKSQRI